MGKYKEVLLFSGGIDSYVAWHYLGKPQTVYFYLSGGYSQRELNVIKRLIPDTIIDHTIDLGDKEQGDNAYIPFRNMLLASLAVSYSDHVIIAGLKDDMVSDKNSDIFLKWSEMFSGMEKRFITVTSPFWHYTKADVIKWYLQNIASEGEALLNTISCYRSGEWQGQIDYNYCGACHACFRKWVALGVNGIELPFHDEKIMNEYYARAKQGHYVDQRNKNIIKMVNREAAGKGDKLDE